MSLILHTHPFALYGQKVLIALYENDTPFEARMVDLQSEQGRAAFAALWPVAKMPVLVDEARGVTLPESSVIIEYLQTNYPGPVQLIPNDADLAIQARLWDRVIDNYVASQVQTIVGNRLRPEGQEDNLGIENARRLLKVAYGVLENQLAGKTWLTGDAFTLADCGAGPALFYANLVMPFEDGAEFPQLAAYFKRVQTRPSFARALEEAKPYRHFFPQPRQAA